MLRRPIETTGLTGQWNWIIARMTSEFPVIRPECARVAPVEISQPRLPRRIPKGEAAFYSVAKLLSLAATCNGLRKLRTRPVICFVSQFLEAYNTSYVSH